GDPVNHLGFQRADFLSVDANHRGARITLVHDGHVHRLRHADVHDARLAIGSPYRLNSILVPVLCPELRPEYVCVLAARLLDHRIPPRHVLSRLEIRGEYVGAQRLGGSERWKALDSVNTDRMNLELWTHDAVHRERTVGRVPPSQIFPAS